MMTLERFNEKTGKGIKIGIIDSGISYTHRIVKDKITQGCFLKYHESIDQIKMTNHYDDDFGHGTAIYGIISQIVPDADIYIIKLLDESLEISEYQLFKALEYINANMSFDILNLSIGLNVISQNSLLSKICEDILERGTILISAFDNAGAISYPAAFNSVIGVDTGENCLKGNDFHYVQDGIVNLRAKGGVQRLAWKYPEYIISQGNSFACAYVSAYAAKIMEAGFHTKEKILSAFREISSYIYSSSEKYSAYIPILNEIKKACIFPFNKEMHSLVRFSELLAFELIEIYDIRQSGQVGTYASRILDSNSLEKDYIIKNIDNIQWGSFDTLVLGHLDELEKISLKNIRQDLCEKCIQYHVNVISFDPIDLDCYNNFIRNGLNAYYPFVNKNNIPTNRFGKMHIIEKPVLMILGTNSKQGKFTLQLELRKLFQNSGYIVGQLGTEPSALLFNMDYVFHNGYNSQIEMERWENCLFTNEILHLIDKKENDIIIVGSQSSVTPYYFANTNYYNSFHIEFIQACQPDAVVVCINNIDSDSYIERTIKTIEGISCGKVIALVLFPMKLREDYGGLTGGKIKMTENEINEIKNRLYDKFQLKIYTLDNKEDLNDLLSLCIDFF